MNQIDDDEPQLPQLSLLCECSVPLPLISCLKCGPRCKKHDKLIFFCRECYEGAFGVLVRDGIYDPVDGEEGKEGECAPSQKSAKKRRKGNFEAFVSFNSSTTNTSKTTSNSTDAIETKSSIVTQSSLIPVIPPVPMVFDPIPRRPKKKKR